MASNGFNIAHKTNIYHHSLSVPHESKSGEVELKDFIDCVNKYANQGNFGFQKLRSLQLLLAGQIPPKNITAKPRKIIANALDMVEENNFDKDWLDDYINAKIVYSRQFKFYTVDQLDEYIRNYGENINIMFGILAGVNPAAEDCLRAEGRALAFSGLLLNLDYDSSMGKNFFPVSELRRFGLPYPNYNNAVRHPGAFREFTEYQCAKYMDMKQIASSGVRRYPYKKRLASNIALDIRTWQINKIAKNPMMLFEKMLFPSSFYTTERKIVRLLGV